ncbi:MAG TPA: hypothetical protein P5081_02300 [Phycisphaerae bacterium]|nr:hypothetical protein [Phycisphaerae bacterium]HRW51688.1 hypothetical protein [Phycisphaerae bacterium]
MDDSDDDRDRLQIDLTSKRGREDYQAILGDRWATILGWTMIAFGVVSMLAFSVLKQRPPIPSRGGAGLVALTIAIVWWERAKGHDNALPLFFCGVVWAVLSILEWASYLN